MKVRNSRKIYLPIYLMVLILIGTLIFIFYNDLPVNKWVLVLIILFIFFSIKYTELHRFSSSFEINKDSLIHTRGLLTKKIRSMDFFAVSDVETKKTLWQRLLGFGDVDVRLYSGESDNPVKNINQPEEFVRFLRKMIDNKRKEASGWE